MNNIEFKLSAPKINSNLNRQKKIARISCRAFDVLAFGCCALDTYLMMTMAHHPCLLGYALLSFVSAQCCNILVSSIEMTQSCLDVIAQNNPCSTVNDLPLP